MKNTSPFASREAMVEYIARAIKSRDEYRAERNKGRPIHLKLTSFTLEEAFRDATNS